MNRVTLWSFMMICIMIILLHMFTSEGFQELLVYRVETNPRVFSIHNKTNIDVSFVRYVPTIRLDKNSQTAKGSILPAYDINNDHHYILTSIPGKIYVVVVTKALALRRLSDNTSLPVHVFQPNQKKIQISKAIMAASSITDRVIGVDSKDQVNADIMIVYGSMAELRSFFASRPEYRIMDYEGVDINIMRLAMPFTNLEDVDVNKEFGLRERFPVFRLVYFDVFIATHLYNTKGVERDLYKLVTLPVLRDQFEKNNYYSVMFKYHPITLQYLRRVNQHIISRGDLPILEQFVDRPIITVSKNIDGYLDGDIFIVSSKEFEVIDRSIMRLRHQRRSHENGDYVLEKRVGSTVYMKRVKAPSTPEGAFVCYNDPSKASKEECLRIPGNVWDRRCVRNEECPFYQKNKTYKNYRGGCNDGFCEFPLGVRGVSFRTYDVKTNPICHGCPVDNLRCCDTQKTPDYAFELDTYERLNTKK